jgi:hypothetical protein
MGGTLTSVIAGLFVIIGSSLTVAAARSLRKVRRLLAGAKVVTGTVVALERRPSAEDIHPAWFPVLEFETLRGQRIRFTGFSGSQETLYRVGETVQVIYDVGDPQNARIKSFADLWLLPLILGALGASFALVGLAVLLGAISLEAP